ncbi:integrase, catalytic region, zinc finger, CCHC-type containing protein [Tanacetum coccineum]
MLEKGNYIPWESRNRRFLDNKLEDKKQMWNSIHNIPYKRPMIPNSNNDQEEILEPLSKITAGNKSQHIANVKLMNYLLQAIPNEIYNLVDACKNAKELWERIKRLMFSSEVTSNVRHSHLIDEFDKFTAKEGESLESVYERLTTLVNITDLVDYEDEYQGELQGDSQEDKLTTTMMLLAQAITQNNQIVQCVPRTESTTGKANVQCYNCNEKGHYARDCQKPKVHDAKYFGEQMLLAMKDEAGSNLNDKENDFMLVKSQ